MKKKSDLKVLFLGKSGDSYCERAVKHLRQTFALVDAYYGDWGEPFPEVAKSWSGDIIISYLSRWIVPDSVISKANFAAINFHPAPPEYPGIGCNNFALYDNVSEYGVTCHYMVEKVDAGSIVAVKRFAVVPDDDVASLLSRAYAAQIQLFFEIVDGLTERRLPESSEQWKRAPYTRRELDELGIIRLGMTENEVARRIRATSYGDFQPELVVGNHRFVLAPGKKDNAT